MRIVVRSLLFIGSIASPYAFGQPTTPPPCSPPYAVQQSFPVSGNQQTAWYVCWHLHERNGLIITAAYFRTAPAANWLKVLQEARVSEIFVPYHPGNPRYRDMTGTVGLSVAPVSDQDCPANGQLVQPPPNNPSVCKEVRDRGLAWKDYGSGRRGQELVLWSALGAANYNYVIEWTFRDDGIFVGRVGATAATSPHHAGITHMHNPIWRLDVDLNGGAHNTVALTKHTESLLDGTATDAMETITTARGIEWDAKQFNFLDISDGSLTNGKGNKISYMLMPLWFGTSRHLEDFTKYDFWVTLADPLQMDATQLPTYVASGLTVQDADIVVWYKGSLHHKLRDEDGEVAGAGWKGETLVMWTGFLMMPNNLFDRTPLYP